MEAVTTLGNEGLAAPTGRDGTVGLVGATLGAASVCSPSITWQRSGATMPSITSSAIDIMSGTSGGHLRQAD
jgi:hypothetical protein